MRATVASQGAVEATLTSVAPKVSLVASDVVNRALALPGWEPAELEPELPVRIAYAGARHLVAAATRERLA